MAETELKTLADKIQEAYANKLGTLAGKAVNLNTKHRNFLENYFLSLEGEGKLSPQLISLLNTNQALFNNFFNNIVMNNISVDGTMNEEAMSDSLTQVNAIYDKLIAVDKSLLNEAKEYVSSESLAEQETPQLALIMTDLLSEKLDNTELKSMKKALKNYIDTENYFECEKSIFNEEFNNIRPAMFSQIGVYQGFSKKNLSKIGYSLGYSFSPEFKRQFHDYVNGFDGNSEKIYNLGHMIRGNKEGSEVKNKQRAFVVVKIAILAMIVGGAVGAFFLPAISGAAGIAFFTAVILVVSYGLADIKQKSFEKELIEDLQKQIDAIRDENILSAELYIAYKKVEVLPDSQEKEAVMNKLNKKLGLNNTDEVDLDKMITTNKKQQEDNTIVEFLKNNPDLFLETIQEIVVNEKNKTNKKIANIVGQNKNFVDQNRSIVPKNTFE